jgi:hypothetical protein
MNGSVDSIGDRWGNIYVTINDFFRRYGNERILYQSSGALYKRKGKKLKPHTVFINRRGNLIISNRRLYFSNPGSSKRSLHLLLSPLYLVLSVGILFLISHFTDLYFNNMTTAIWWLIALPWIIIMMTLIGLDRYQRNPIEVFVPFHKVELKYIGTYRSITRDCPMFSCFDGLHTYFFVGYRELDDVKMRELDRILSVQRSDAFPSIDP